MHHALHRIGLALSIALTASASAQTPNPNIIPRASAPGQSQIVAGKHALAAKQFAQAKAIFASELKLHPENIEAKLGLADSELGLQHYETAELEYRQVVAAQPELWQAHKNLVIVEAALGRWEEFDRERTVLRMARQRNAPGISARESDVIDSFTIHGERWIVREYFEPVGRSQTRYNFEHFAPTSHAAEYISLESAEAAKAVTPGGAVAIGDQSKQPAPNTRFALNWYTGKGHGNIATYGHKEPTYEQVRTDVQKWLRRTP